MTVLTYTLRLLEPVLVTKPGGDPNTDESEAFIPGSAVRGALAGLYLDNGGKVDVDFTRLFLNGRTRFLNAYLADDDGLRALPTPMAWQVEKGAESPMRIYDRSQMQDKGKEEKDETHHRKQRVKLGAEFMWWRRDEIAISAELQYAISVHTSRNRKMGRAVEGDTYSALYRYRALAAGQTFHGAIVIDDAADGDTLADLLKGRILIGGSHTAGYGLVEIEHAPAPDSWREIDAPRQEIAAGDLVMFHLLSDAILRDDTGQPTADLSAALPKTWQDALELKQQFTRMTWVGGFNRAWGLPLPQSWAVQRGSVWIYEATRDIPAAMIAKLEAAGIGSRRVEGFGRVAVNPPWHQASTLTWVKADALELVPDVREGVTDQSKAADLLNQMQQRLAEQELDRLVVQAAQDIVTRTLPKDRRIPVSKSQLARLRRRVQQLNQDPEKDKDLPRGKPWYQTFVEYLDGIEKRKSANDQFRRFFIRPLPERQNKGEQEERKQFLKWLCKLVKPTKENPESTPEYVWEIIIPDNWKPPELVTGFDYNTEQRRRHYAVRLIDGVCEQLAKKGKTR